MIKTFNLNNYITWLLIYRTSNLAEKLLPKDNFKSLLCIASNKKQLQQEIFSLIQYKMITYSFGP